MGNSGEGEEGKEGEATRGRDGVEGKHRKGRSSVQRGERREGRGEGHGKKGRGKRGRAREAGFSQGAILRSEMLVAHRPLSVFYHTVT